MTKPTISDAVDSITYDLAERAVSRAYHGNALEGQKPIRAEYAQGTCPCGTVTTLRRGLCRDCWYVRGKAQDRRDEAAEAEAMANGGRDR